MVNSKDRKKEATQHLLITPITFFSPSSRYGFVGIAIILLLLLLLLLSGFFFFDCSCFYPSNFFFLLAQEVFYFFKKTLHRRYQQPTHTHLCLYAHTIYLYILVLALSFVRGVTDSWRRYAQQPTRKSRN